MSYHVEFRGQFDLDKPLTLEHAAYLRAFAKTRRMRRDVERAASLPDPVREAVGLPLGREGGYFVGGTGFRGQDLDPSVLDRNRPPAGQPDLWCCWTATAGGEGIGSTGDEGSHWEFVSWLRYLIGHFLAPWGYSLSGSVRWQGEGVEDHGVITTADHVVSATRTP